METDDWLLTHSQALFWYVRLLFNVRTSIFDVVGYLSPPFPNLVGRAQWMCERAALLLCEDRWRREATAAGAPLDSVQQKLSGAGTFYFVIRPVGGAPKQSEGGALGCGWYGWAKCNALR